MLSELINPLHFSIVLGPLSVYLLLLGMINLSSRPFVTTGARDAAALGVGIGGMILVGPLHLLLPSATIYHWGSTVWLLLLAFYVLLLSLTVLLIRPRLIIYNIPSDRVRPILSQLATSLDSEARWAGGCLVLPQLRIQLHVEANSGMRNVQLVSAGPQQSFEGWRRLERELVAALRETKGERNPVGFSLVFAGLLVVSLLTFCLVQDANMVAQSVHDIFDFTSERRP